ncbi:MAG: four helix bundle protein [Chitinophagaceae bacterium]|nr:four helix bundle protein [Chitinophagaceae bacterium]
MNDFSYKKLIVWQKAIRLLKLTYTIVAKLPKHEEFNLKDQLRRASLSVSSNIAEGSCRKSLLERKRFYEVARSSVIEIDSQLEAGIILEYITPQDCIEINNIIIEEFKMLTKMMERE